ncbi:MAG: YdcH family protein [Boseongicola sp.]
MTKNPPQKMEPDEVLKVKLEALKREHGDLDEAIRALEEKPARDPLTVRRLKKQKLSLKDRIAIIEDQLTPDIIA